MGSNYHSEIAKGNEWFRKHPGRIPNISQYIGYFLGCSQYGGAFDNNKSVESIKLLHNKIIGRIKNKSVITDENDLLFQFIDYCKRSAIDGVFIPDRVISFSQLVAYFYLTFKKNGNDVGVILQRNGEPCSLSSINVQRKELFKDGYTPNELVTRMLDYVEANRRQVDRIELFNRYDEAKNQSLWNFYTAGSAPDDVYRRYMRDVKLYIHPKKFGDAISSCKLKISLAVLPIYVQTLILLEYSQPYDEILEFIRRKAPNDFDAILKELSDYSRKGVEFYKYVCEKLGRVISDRDRERLNKVQLQNELAEKQKEANPNNSQNNINFNSIYDRTVFRSRKDETIYLREQTKHFRIPSLIKGEGKRGIILVDYDNYYGLSSISDPKKALVDLYSFTVGLSKTKDEKSIDNFYRFLHNDSETGYPFIEIESQDGILHITTSIPDKLSGSQIRVLNDVLKLLNNSLDSIRPIANAQEVKRCIDTIKSHITKSEQTAIFFSDARKTRTIRRKYK